MIHSANAGGHACSVVLTHQRSPLGDKRSLPISRSTPVSDALRQTTRIDARNEATATDRVNDVVRLVSRLLIAGLALTAAVSVILLARAANRGLDLTDEGIYLHAYRGWKFYDLSITGAGAVLGPVFQLLGWSIPALRLLKLVCLLASSAFLAFATTEFVHHHFKAQILRREKQALVVLISILSAFSVYAWLPQSPGYNDLSIMLSAVSIGLAFLWAISTGRRSTVFAVLIGVAIILLIFVVVVIAITLYQERKTERALEALRDLSSPRALVVRGGARKRIAGREVVPGDVLVLSEGDRVPADGILLSAVNLATDESLLTGESVPVRKQVASSIDAEMARPGGDDLPFIFSGTLVVRGTGLALKNYLYIDFFAIIIFIVVVSSIFNTY